MRIADWLRKAVLGVSEFVRRAAGGGTDRNWGNSFAAAVEYLTPFPAFWAESYDREEIENSLAWLPVAGVGIGLLAAFFCWIFGLFLPQLAVAAFAVVFLVKATGGQGLSGLADFGTRALTPVLRRKAGLPPAENGLGGGLFLAVGALVAKVVLLGSLSPGRSVGAVLLMAVAGRSAMVLGSHLAKYAGDAGQIEAVLWQGRSQDGLIAGMIIWGAVAMLTLWVAGVFAFALTAGYVVAYVYYCRYRFGGLDGGSFQALGEASELMTVLVLAIGI